MKNILELLEKAKLDFPDKNAFLDEQRSVTYSVLEENAKRIGSSLANLDGRNQAVLVCIDKSVECIESMMGVVYSGNFYVVMDVHMPLDRAANIVNTVHPIALIVADSDSPFTSIAGNATCLTYSESVSSEIDDEYLASVRKRMIDTDPLYALFTSGSTGVPKGAVLNHKNVLSYAQWVTEAFDITSETIYGSQTPFYFSMSVLDIFSTIQNAATLCMIPKSLFSFPLKLLEYLNNHKVNTIYWVPSALSLVANWKALDYVEVPTLKKILFAGEVMPTRQLNIWRKHFPDAMYANLYGPTEVTDICTYYVVNREFADDESLPIGNACNNCDVFVLKEDNTEAEFGEKGELCVRGSFLAAGYYDNPEKTQQVFVQNPLNPHYPEMIYKTGDIVRYNQYGELDYINRKDYQIKHMGYRIELGEIEVAASSIEEMKLSCCVYDDKKDHIVLIYEGKKLDKSYIMDSLAVKLPPYMYPNKIIHMNQLPHNANGKIDRAWLKNNYQTL